MKDWIYVLACLLSVTVIIPAIAAFIVEAVSYMADLRAKRKRPKRTTQTDALWTLFGEIGWKIGQIDDATFDDEFLAIDGCFRELREGGRHDAGALKGQMERFLCKLDSEINAVYSAAREEAGESKRNRQKQTGLIYGHQYRHGMIVPLMVTDGYNRHTKQLITNYAYNSIAGERKSISGQITPTKIASNAIRAARMAALSDGCC